MTVTRQHADTEISELAGRQCQSILGVGAPTTECDMLSLFFNIEGIWYRATLDVGVLFWEPSEPDPDTELDDDEVFIDLSSRISASPLCISFIRMRDGQLHVEFDSSQRVTAVENADNGLLKVEVSST